MPRKSLGVRVTLLAIRGYQLLFSSLYTGSCRFSPSCSHYAMEAIDRFGVPRGAWLAARRLMRCHPFGSHGLDPVPHSLPRQSSARAKAGA